MAHSDDSSEAGSDGSESFKSLQREAAEEGRRRRKGPNVVWGEENGAERCADMATAVAVIKALPDADRRQQ